MLKIQKLLYFMVIVAGVTLLTAERNVVSSENEEEAMIAALIGAEFMMQNRSKGTNTDQAPAASSWYKNRKS